MLAIAATAGLLVQCTAAPQPTEVPGTSASAAGAPGAPTAATVTGVTARELGTTWRPGCPVEPEQLRRVAVDHIGFDGRVHRGELVAHEDTVPRIIAAFERLYRLQYPIEKIRTADHYPGAVDELSMQDNNTSAFSCRDIPGTGRWSLHAYGRAVDVNPLLNPSVTARGTFEPATAATFLDRSRTDPGLLHDGDRAVRAFTDHGWRWGGHWTSPVDYQHFESS